MPLHIFEPRYRRMLEDIHLRDNLFGLSYFDVSASDSTVPPLGHVGCVAEVTEVQAMPDGRSNILTVGLIRYHVESYVEHGEPYLIGTVSFFEDEEEDEEYLSSLAGDVSALFQRIALAVRIINDERAALPELPDVEPEQLSFLVAAAIDIATEVKLELLEGRSTSERLRRLRELLSLAVNNYEERARMHVIARGNGHAGKKIDLE
jgi:Lon protease-like protein